MVYLEYIAEDESKRSFVNLSLILKVPQTSMENKKKFTEIKITHLIYYSLKLQKSNSAHLFDSGTPTPFLLLSFCQFLFMMNVHLK